MPQAARWFLLLLACFTACGNRGPGGPGDDGGEDPALSWVLTQADDARIARMLGAEGGLPDHCQLLGRVIAPERVRGRYRCGSMPGPFEVQLRHVSSTHVNVVRTERFAVVRVDPGGGPDVLVAELARRVRREEAAMTWRRASPPAAADAGPPTAPPLPDVRAVVDASILDAATAPDAPLPDARAAESAPVRDAATALDTPVPVAVRATDVPSQAPSAEDAGVSAGPAAPGPAPGAPPAGRAVRERQGRGQRYNPLGWWYQPPPFASPGGYAALRHDDLLGGLLAWCTDGVLFLALVAAGLVALLRRQMQESPRWVPVALGGVTAAGAALRLLISQDAPMNAFAFERVLPLAAQIYHGPVIASLTAATGVAVLLPDTISWTNFALACLTPPAVFAHARYLLRDDRAALAAALMLATLPMHIRFSRSDVQFIASLLSSSLTFVTLYGALTERSPRWSRAFLVLLPLLSLATYLSRPENIIFAALDGGAILLYADRDVPRRRRLLVVALVFAAALWSLRINLLAHFSANVRDGLSLRTLENALRVFRDPARNTLFNPSMTPVGLGVLAALGFASLWRAGDRRRAAFLVLWLAAFFVVHSYVYAAPMMMSRYHLHLVTPLILLAAAAVPTLLRLGRWVAPALALYACAWPAIHLRFERDVAFSEMHELAFLRRVRGEIPADCAVLEFSPASSPSTPGQIEASRVGRVAGVVSEGRMGAAFRFVNLAVFDPDRRYTHRDAEPLTDDARRLLAAPPSCLMIYEGLTCRTHVPEGATVAPACAEALARVRAVPVRQTTFAARRYDDPNAGRMVDDGRGGIMSLTAVPDGRPITLTLWRVLGPR